MPNIERLTVLAASDIGAARELITHAIRRDDLPLICRAIAPHWQQLAAETAQRMGLALMPLWTRLIMAVVADPAEAERHIDHLKDCPVGEGAESALWVISLPLAPVGPVLWWVRLEAKKAKEKNPALYEEQRRRDLAMVGIDAYLTGANLRNADLSGADLSNADLTNADLTNADLTNANLDSANLTGANLRGAKHSPATRWPAGYSPLTPPQEN